MIKIVMLSIFREKIQNDYKRRKRKNPSFSKRSYAKHIGINHTSLIDFISGKTSLSIKNATKVSSYLKLSDEEKELFFESIQCSINGTSNSEFLNLEDLDFHPISDWIYYAVLNLESIDDHSSSPKWIANYFNVDESKISEVLDTLIDNGYIVIENDKIVRITKNLASTVDIPSDALKKHHKQKLQIAIDSLEKTSVEERDFSSVTMSINRTKLPLAKKLIFQFKRDLCKVLEAGKRDEVYALNIQLLPLKNFSPKSDTEVES